MLEVSLHEKTQDCRETANTEQSREWTLDLGSPSPPTQLWRISNSLNKCLGQSLKWLPGSYLRLRAGQGGSENESKETAGSQACLHFRDENASVRRGQHLSLEAAMALECWNDNFSPLLYVLFCAFYRTSLGTDVEHIDAWCLSNVTLY